VVDGAKKFDTINPAQPGADAVAEASSADVDRAVAAARRAFEDRNGMAQALCQRTRAIIWKLADLLEKNMMSSPNSRH